MTISRRRLLLAGAGTVVASDAVWANKVLANAVWADEPFQEITRKSEEAVQRGTSWLIKSMHRDGGCGIDIGQAPDIGCTAMVGLALLSQGNTPVEGPRSREVRDIMSFLMRAVDVMNGDDIASTDQTQIQRKIGRHAHSFFAALFLSQVLGESWNPEPILAALIKLTGAITRSQSATGLSK